MEEKTPFQLAWERATQQDEADDAAVAQMTAPPVRIVVSRAEYDRLIAELEASPKELPWLRELLKSRTPFTEDAE